MSNTETGGPAFPGWHTVSDRLFHDEGLSLRDHFAGLAMQGLLAGGPDALARSNKKLVPFSYEIADAMIAERSKAKPA